MDALRAESFVSLFVMRPEAGLPEGAVGTDEGGTPKDAWRQRRVFRLTAVGVFGLAFWFPYTFRAGFVYDDWAAAAGQKFHVSLVTSYRPGFILWEGIVVRVFQDHPVGYYLTSAVLVSALAVMAVVALEGLGVPPLAATGVGVLLAVSPYADSLGLWWTATQMSLAMVLGLASVAFGVRWIKRCRHARVNLAVSLVLLVAATLTYEAVAPIVLLPLALITFSKDRRRVLAWSVPGVVTAGVAALFMFERALTPNHKTARPVSQYPSRIWTLVRSGTTTFVHHLVGFLTSWDLLIALVVAGACYAGWHFASPRSEPEGAGWQGSVGAVLVCLALTYVAWGPYIPANDYYIPGQFGIGNRINLLAQLFFLTAVGLVGVILVRTTSRRTATAAIGVALAGGLFAAVFASSFAQTHRDQSDYLFANSQRNKIIGEVQQLLPRVGEGDEVILAGYHLTASPQWVPVLSADWDTTAALDLLYDNGTITGQPVSSSLGCADNGLTQPPLEQITRVPYRHIVVLELSTHRVESMANRSRCRAELATLRVNPNPILAP